MKVLACIDWLFNKVIFRDVTCIITSSAMVDFIVQLIKILKCEPEWHRNDRREDLL